MKIPKEFLGTFEAARQCRVSPGTVIRWIKEGKLPASVTAGGHHRISAADLTKFMQTLRMPVPGSLQPSFQFKILIVDDEKEIRSMIRRTVDSEFPQAVIEEAGDGFTAGWKVRDFHPQLVLLDISMPGQDGFQVIQRVRQYSLPEPPRILVISGRPAEEIEKKALGLGADGFLQKPFLIQELQEKISFYMEQYRRKQHAA